MDIDLEVMLKEVKEQAGTLMARCALLVGQLAALQKHSDNQAAELVEISQANAILKANAIMEKKE